MSFQAPPTSLLASLERDFGAQGKTTVKECLRSKALIDPCVRKVLAAKENDDDNPWEASDLQISYYAILSSYLARIKQDMTTTGNQVAAATTKTTESSMSYMSRAGTVVRFVQLLLEQKKETDQKQVQDWTLQLLKGLVGVACSCAQHGRLLLDKESKNNSDNDDDDNDDTMDFLFETSNAVETVHPLHVTLFVFGSLLRLDPYVQSKPFLLSPLWKGLCDIATSILPSPLPTQLLQQAFQALVHHLQDGTGRLLETMSTTTTTMDPKVNAFVITIVRFLVARLSTFMGMPTTSGMTKGPVFGQALEVLCLAIGLEMVLVHEQQLDKSLVKLYKQLAAKTEKCLYAWLAPPTTTTETLDNRRVGALLKVRPTSSTRTTTAQTAIAVGKLSCYTRLLAQACRRSIDQEGTEWQEQDAQVALRICEEILLHLLPTCWGLSCASDALHPLLASAMKVVVFTLYECQVRVPCLASRSNNTQPGKRRFHYMLLRWLSKGANNRQQPEGAILAVSLHLAELCADRSSSDGVSLLRLLVKLVFDVRTESTLRRNMTSVLIRLASQRPNDLERLLRAEFQTLHNGLGSKKRKRTTGSAWAAPELETIAFLMSKVCGTADNDTAPLVVDESSSLSVLRLTTLQFGVAGSPIKMLENTNVLTRLMEQVARQGDTARRAQVVSLMTILFRRLGGMLATSTRLSNAQLQQVLLLIQTSIECNVAKDETEQNLCFEAIRLVAFVGQASLSAAPKPILDRQAQMFHSLLSDPSWAVRAFAMSSLVSYASTLPSVHKTVLPACLPSSMQSLLQCRLQGSLPPAPPDVNATTSLLVDRTARPCWKAVAARKLFTTSSSLTISSQSLILRMPTQEGRSAIVIFPPGDQSREDIQFMLSQDDEGAGNQILQRVETMQDGSGKFLLRQED